ncbi:MAG: UbiA family prenyltransferase [Proteobacteria bacterium]|nr:UbiA family prenyltransferase [Pseudomonadota bacterium]
MGLRQVCQLTRWKVSLLAACSTFTGAAAFSAAYALQPAVLVPTAGTLFLALGASALNQVQERELDARMERTRGRPIPVGAVSLGAASLLGVLCVVGGAAVLAAGAGWTAALLGVAAVAWYNGVYTYLKRVTAFAALPGALVGALPPVIGWTAAGGNPLDPRALALAVVFLFWQVPHFWLLLLRWGPDYEQAGLPSLTAVFGREQLARISLAWLVAAGAVGVLIPLYELGRAPWALVYPGAGLALIAVLGAGLALLETWRFHLLAFRSVNTYLLAMMALLTADRLLRLA